MTIRAVLFDFGGVILSSPFEAFNDYEERQGLPRDFIRTLPGQTGADIRAMLDDVLGELSDRVSIDVITDESSTASPFDTPLWDAMNRVGNALVPGGAECIPFLTVGATDARFFRRMGIPSYGFGLFSNNMSYEDYGSMFHGDNERVDVESLRLSTELWQALSRDFLGA